MHLFIILPAALLLLAALLWYTQARPRADSPSPAAAPPLPGPAPGTVEALTAAVAALQSLMSHPALGGPGFLTVRFSDGHITVSAQYPNIQEALYRRVVRQELSPPDLLSEGFPEKLLQLSPEFETESGGMVLLTVQISAPDPALLHALTSRRARQTVLNILAAELRPRFPDLSIRALGGELLLTPLRETAADKQPR